MVISNQNTDINNFIRDATNSQGFAATEQFTVPNILSPVLITNPEDFAVAVSVTGVSTEFGPTAGTGQAFKADTLGETNLAAAGTATIYTVTAGKTFFMTSLSIGLASAATAELDFRDNTTGPGLVNVYGGTAALPGMTMSFPTPVPFTHSVVLKNNGGAGMFCAASVQGYEE